MCGREYPNQEAASKCNRFERDGWVCRPRRKLKMVEFNYDMVCPNCGGKIIKIGGCTQCANGCGFVGSCDV